MYLSMTNALAYFTGTPVKLFLHLASVGSTVVEHLPRHPIVKASIQAVASENMAKSFEILTTWAQCYKTFYGCSLQMFEIS
jgi:hypothetical protein